MTTRQAGQLQPGDRFRKPANIKGGQPGSDIWTVLSGPSYSLDKVLVYYSAKYLTANGFTGTTTVSLLNHPDWPVVLVAEASGQ